MGSQCSSLTLTSKTNRNKHFPRSFLLNYGRALQNLSDDAVLNRIHHWNCEWLTRPNIAMSETATTLKKNLELIQLYWGMIFTNGFIDEIESVLEHCAGTMEIRQQGQLRSNAAYLGRRNQHLTTIARRQTRGRIDAGRILLGGTPVPSGSTLHSTECAITRLPGICVKNGTQQQQRKPPNGSNFFSGHINSTSPNLLGQISGKKTKHCQDH